MNSVTGAGAEAFGTGTFKYHVSCTNDGASVLSQDLALKAQERATTKELPVGSVCVVTETDSANADATTDAVTVTINEAEVALAEFVNTFGAATVSAKVTATGTGMDLLEDFLATRPYGYNTSVYCDFPSGEAGMYPVNFSYSDLVSGNAQLLEYWPDEANAGQPRLFPLGTKCHLEIAYTYDDFELFPASSVTSQTTWEDPLVLSSQDLNEVANHSVSQEMVVDATTFTVIKKVAGNAPTEPAEYKISVLCYSVTDSSPSVYLESTVSLKHGESASFRTFDLERHGVECEVKEKSGDATVTFDAPNSEGKRPWILDVDWPADDGYARWFFDPTDGGTVTVTNTFSDDDAVEQDASGRRKLPKTGQGAGAEGLVVLGALACGAFYLRRLHQR